MNSCRSPYGGRHISHRNHQPANGLRHFQSRGVDFSRKIPKFARTFPLASTSKKGRRRRFARRFVISSGLPVSGGHASFGVIRREVHHGQAKLDSTGSRLPRARSCNARYRVLRQVRARHGRTDAAPLPRVTLLSSGLETALSESPLILPYRFAEFGVSRNESGTHTGRSVRRRLSRHATCAGPSVPFFPRLRS